MYNAYHTLSRAMDPGKEEGVPASTTMRPSKPPPRRTTTATTATTTKRPSMPRAYYQQQQKPPVPRHPVAEPKKAFASTRPVAAEGQFDDASDDEYEPPTGVDPRRTAVHHGARRAAATAAPGGRSMYACAPPSRLPSAVEARASVLGERSRNLSRPCMNPFGSAEDLFKLEALYRVDPALIAREPLLQEMLREEQALFAQYQLFQQRHQAIQRQRDQEALEFIFGRSRASRNMTARQHLDYSTAVSAAAPAATGPRRVVDQEETAIRKTRREYAEPAVPTASFESSASSADGSLQWLALACGQERQREEEQDKIRGGIPEPAINTLLSLSKVTPDALQDDEDNKDEEEEEEDPTEQQQQHQQQEKKNTVEYERTSKDRALTRWEVYVQKSVAAEEEVARTAIRTKHGPRKPQKSWTARVEELQAYRDHFGHCQVRQYAAGATLERELAAWLANCRCRFRGGTLKSEKAQELHALGCEGFGMDGSADHDAVSFGDEHTSPLKKLKPRKDMADNDEMTPQEDMYATESEEDHQPRVDTEHMTGVVGIHIGDSERPLMRLPFISHPSPLLAPLLLGGDLHRVSARKPDPPGETDRMSPSAIVDDATLLSSMAIVGLDSAVVPEQRWEEDAAPAIAADAAAAMEENATNEMEEQGGRPAIATSFALGEDDDQNYAASASSLEKKHRKRKTFDERLGQMIDFYREHGHFQVLTRGEHSDLGRWLSNTRTKLRDGKLAPHLKEKLRALFQADGSFALMENSDCQVEEEAVAIATASRRSSGASTTTPAMLDEDHLYEDASSVPEEETAKQSGSSRKNPKMWEDSFALLEEFKRDNGHCNVRIQKGDKHESLGRWLASNRCRFKMGQLQPDKAQRLMQIGCTGFEDESAGLTFYNAMHGSSGKTCHSPVVRRPTIDPYSDVGDRDDDNKRKFDSDEDSVQSYISAEDEHGETAGKKPLLNSFGARVAHVKAFKDRHGHANIRITSNDDEEEKLGKWLSTARTRHKAGTLGGDQAAILHELGCFGFEPNHGIVIPCESSYSDEDAYSGENGASGHQYSDAVTSSAENKPPRKKRRLPPRQSFDEMLVELIEFQKKHGVNASVPKPDGDEGKLGRWLAFQRRQYLAGKLRLDRVQALHDTGRHGFDPAVMKSQGALSSDSVGDSEEDSMHFTNGKVMSLLDP